MKDDCERSCLSRAAPSAVALFGRYVALFNEKLPKKTRSETQAQYTSVLTPS